jgi:hypothetical protein
MESQQLADEQPEHQQQIAKLAGVTEGNAAGAAAEVVQHLKQVVRKSAQGRLRLSHLFTTSG